MPKLTILLINCLLLISFGWSTNAQASPLPWLKTIGAEQRLTTIHTIVSSAKVSVSDGLTYTANTLFHDHQRAIFQRLYPDRAVTHGVEGKYIWAYDGKTETEAPQMMSGIVLGHQIHAQILFFDQLHQVKNSASPGQFNGQEAFAMVSESEDKTWTFYYDEKKQPLGMKLLPKGQKPITFGFSKWQSVDGISLPFSVLIDDGNRKFQYNYQTITFNQGNLGDFRAPDNKITEQQRLLRMHRMIMDDHFFGRTTDMASFTGDNVTIVSGGEIYPMTGSANDAQMTKIMGNRNYTIYDDLIRPQVKVSDDGTLGWVIVQVSAKGIRLDENGKPTEPLAFVSGWIELYQKVKNQWKMVGNVSNFR